MKITILTLFPKMFSGPFDYSIVKKAREKQLVEINFVDIRDFGLGKHKIVDDKPYGGGQGMILRVDVLKKAIDLVVDKKLRKNEQKIVLLSPSGRTYTQKTAGDFSKLKHLILICGHYEGVDERIKKFINLEISIGNYVLTGGEIPAMVIVDSVVRLLKGVLKAAVVENESFSQNSSALEYPQYTRPEAFENIKVPTILTSGNHQKIAEWNKNESFKRSKKATPQKPKPRE